jgi:hypothetical protein
MPSKKIVLRKDPDGYYDRGDLNLLNTLELIELLMSETSYQETMNIVRLESFKILETV